MDHDPGDAGARAGQPPLPPLPPAPGAAPVVALGEVVAAAAAEDVGVGAVVVGAVVVGAVVVGAVVVGRKVGAVLWPPPAGAELTEVGLAPPVLAGVVGVLLATEGVVEDWTVVGVPEPPECVSTRAIATAAMSTTAASPANSRPLRLRRGGSSGG